MSDYWHVRVIRLKIDKERFSIEDVWDVEERPELENLFKSRNEDGSKRKHMSVAPTEEPFIDYVFYEKCEGSQNWGYSRLLTEEELEEYLPLFRQISAEVTADDLRYVEFCWYNCTEAESYFEEGFKTEEDSKDGYFD